MSALRFAVDPSTRNLSRLRTKICIIPCIDTLKFINTSTYCCSIVRNPTEAKFCLYSGKLSGFTSCQQYSPFISSFPVREHRVAVTLTFPCLQTDTLTHNIANITKIRLSNVFFCESSRSVLVQFTLFNMTH